VIPGVHPRISLPLTWAGLACYWWMLVVGRHHSNRWWWTLPGAALFLVTSLVLAARQGHGSRAWPTHWPTASNPIRR
jgi:hypothetical protein